MKTGKITAKLRDAVPVCLMVNSEEVKRYKNIDLPDAIKKIEMQGFKFNVPVDGEKITFEIHYEVGALPEVFPEARAKISRAERALQKATETVTPPIEEPTSKVEAITEPEIQDTNTAVTSDEEPRQEANANVEATEEPKDMEIAFNLTGVRRKELVAAISKFTGLDSKYKAAPSFAFEIGDYTVDKTGTLTGAVNPALLDGLKEKGFIAAE